MKEYLCFLFKFICLCVLVGMFIFYVVMPQYKMGFCAAFKDKFDLEHTEGNEPRILLMGDSNVAFGFDSELIEEAFDIRVVNLGLHGGLGQSFCMDIAKSGIREGDIVIILPCNYSFSARDFNGTLAWTLLENNVSLWREVNPEDYRVLARAFPSYLKNALNLWVNKNGNLSAEGVYARDRFNSYGDIITTGAVNVMENKHFPIGTPTIVSEGLINYYNEYNQYVMEQGAVMLAAGSPIIDCPDRPTDEEYEAAYEKVKAEIQFAMISDWQDYVYPMDYFFDTNDHLNDSGRTYRTKQLIKDIENWMENAQYGR